MTTSHAAARFGALSVAAAAVFTAAPAFAQGTPASAAAAPPPAALAAPAPSASPAPTPAAKPAPAAVPVAASPPRRDTPSTAFTAADAERARFSGGRLVVGILGSAVGGSAAAYGTYKGICGDDPCIGGALAGLGANLVVTPVLSYGIGRLMGGRGTFSSVLLGAGVGFGVSAPLMAKGNTGLIIGLALMPIMGPLAFEFSSNGRARQMKEQLGSFQLSPYVAPPSSARSALRLPTTYGLVGSF